MATKRKPRNLIPKEATVKVQLRLPKSRHRELRRRAKDARTSLHAEILRRLAYGGKPVEWDQQFVWMVHTIQMIWERLYGEQAQTRPPAQNGSAPQQRAPESRDG